MYSIRQNVYWNQNIGEMLLYLNIYFIILWVNRCKTLKNHKIFNFWDNSKVKSVYYVIFSALELWLLNIFSKYHIFFLSKYIWKRGALTPKKGERLWIYRVRHKIFGIYIKLRTKWYIICLVTTYFPDLC